jgi:hypothetical protein
MKTLRDILLIPLIVMLLLYMAIGAPVTLEWDASAGALSYELHYGTDPANLNNVRVSDTTDITIPELAPGVWHFAVRAVGLNGLKSPFSEPITHTVVAPPEAPKNLRVVEIQTSSNLKDWKTIALVPQAPDEIPAEFVRARIASISKP